MLDQTINIFIPSGHVFSHQRHLIRTEQIRLSQILLDLLASDYVLDCGPQLELNLGNRHHLLALGDAEIELVDPAQDAVEGVLVSSGLLLELVLVEPEHGHQQLVDVVISHPHRIGLVGEVEVDYLQHLRHLEGSEVLVHVEVLLLDE